MAFENYNPNGYRVVCELTEGDSKGYRAVIMVPVMHKDFEALTNTEFRAKYGYQDMCRTLDEAHNRIKADMEMCRATTDASGLIHWGKSPAREYAIYKITAERVE